MNWWVEGWYGDWAGNIHYCSGIMSNAELVAFLGSLEGLSYSLTQTPYQNEDYFIPVYNKFKEVL